MREIDTPLGHVFIGDNRRDPEEIPLQRTETVTYYAGSDAFWTARGALACSLDQPPGKRPEVFKQTIIRETLRAADVLVTARPPTQQGDDDET